MIYVCNQNIWNDIDSLTKQVSKTWSRELQGEECIHSLGKDEQTQTSPTNFIKEEATRH
jgi:hypothetical protein